MSSAYPKREIKRTPFAKTYRLGERGNPRAPGACLWCGVHLPASSINAHHELRAEYPLRGDYADGAFCGLRCGYAFGLAAAIAGTRWIVGEKRINTEDQTMKQNGFTLIEIMIVIAIIGILAAVALPAYQDYVTRSKVSELLLAGDACRTSVLEYYQSQAKWPSDQNASGCGDQKTRYVDKLSISDNGVITVTAKTGPGALDTAAAGDIQLVPTATSTGHFDWACNGSGTTIRAKFLPAICR